MKLLSLPCTVFLLVALGCHSPSADAPADKQAAPPPNAPTAVATVPVTSHNLNTTVNLPAQLVPYESVDIFPKVTGFVQSITVDRGSHVRRGQLLVRLTAPELGSQRAQADAGVRAAQSQFAAAEAKLASDNGTYQHMLAAAKTPGVLAENDVDVAHQTVTADASQVAAAKQNITAAQEALRSVSQTESYLNVIAPFDGVVTTRNLHPGALIGPASGAAAAEPILQIATESRLRLVVPVPEAQVGAMKVGQLVSFTVPAYPGQTFKAPIRRISGEVAQTSRTMPVELDVDNRDGRLSPGSFTSVAWPLQRSTPSLFVPPTSVTTDQQHTFVIKVQNNTAQWVTVQTGQTVGSELEVFGPLQPGDQVVKAASDAIHSGDKLQVQTH